MKFLQANTFVSDGPIVSDVDRGIIIGRKISGTRVGCGNSTAGCRQSESRCAVRS